MSVLFTNNAASTLGVAISAVDTTLVIQALDAAHFPVPAGGDWFPVTVVDPSVDPSNNLEIMRCTARSGAVLTVLRGREGTTARAFPIGSRIDHRLTAVALAEIGGEVVGGVITIGSTAPPSPAINDVWIDTT